MRLMLAPMTLFALAAPAFASDGVSEINQACAVQTGCFAGDSAGFPVTITTPGSFRLTSNLDLRAVSGAANIDAIAVNVGSVSVDLGGFAILGATVCNGTPPGGDLNCAPTGSGRGVSAAAQSKVSVTNGIVNGVGSTGVACGKGCLVTNLQVENCGLSGIVASNGSVIRGNTLQRNGASGITFATLGGLIIQGNTTIENGGDGILSGGGDLIEGNIARNNRDDGIFVNGGAMASGNSSVANGGDGFEGFNTCRLVENNASLNAGAGLRLGAGCSYERNQITSNTGGSVIGGAQSWINFCDTDTICP